MNLVKLQDTKLVHNNHLPFLYTNKERSEREIKETTTFTIAWKRINIGINLPKEAKDLYSESCKMLMKEIKDYTDGEIHHVLGLEESIL